MQESQITFLIMIGIGLPVFAAITSFAFALGQYTRQHGKHVEREGIEPKGSWVLGFPRQDRKIVTQQDKHWLRLLGVYSNVLIGFGCILTLLTIGFVIFAFWASFIR